MLNKNVFFGGIEKLEVEYADRGFVMTKEKAKQWYDFMKDISDTEYMKKIDSCLKTCKRVPYMSDVLELKEEDMKPVVNSGARREITFAEDIV